MDLRLTSRMSSEWGASADGGAVAADDPYKRHKRARLVRHRGDGRPIALRTADAQVEPFQHSPSSNASSKKSV
jgi:hypothetical protein